MTSISSDAFAYCSTIENVKIPESVELIEAQAFFSCSNLQSVTIPESVKQIGEHAFTNEFFGAYLIEIHSAFGSEAQKYADENHIRFVELH